MAPTIPDHIKFSPSNDALGWFEELYRRADGDPSYIPWADLQPNPNLIDWVKNHPVKQGKRALNVGCGLGDDAEYLSGLGLHTTAFDISPSAIRWCRERFPESTVDYHNENLFNPPGDWHNAFDFILEINTLQALPSNLRNEAMSRIASLLAPGGILLVICRGREPYEPAGHRPWPLTREELARFKNEGLTEIEFEDYPDGEKPPVRRFRMTCRK